MKTLFFEKGLTEWDDSWVFPSGFYDCERLVVEDAVEIEIDLGDEGTQFYDAKVIEVKFTLSAEACVQEVFLGG